ncbi:MAG: membrane protein insertase YidC, partial [Pseudomonadota bacterium]
MTDQKNMIIAVVLSLAVILGWEFLFPSGSLFGGGQTEPPAQTQVQPQTAQTPGQPAVTAPSTGAGELGAPQANVQATPGVVAPAAPNAGPSRLPRAAALGTEARIPFENDRMTGSIRLRGARIDDAVLRDYRETVDPNSAQVAVFGPENGPSPHFAEIGWAAA